MSGGNYKEYIEEPDFGRWREVFEAGNGLIRLMTVAPELHGIDGIIDDALKNGIVIALGHSLAGSEIAAAAIERGARQVTHLQRDAHASSPRAGYSCHGAPLG